MMELCTTVLVCDIADKISKGALERKFLFWVVLLSELAFRLDVPVLFWCLRMGGGGLHRKGIGISWLM